MALLLVPFNPNWVSAVGQSGAPLLDIKAIYTRPRKTREGDPILDEAGFPEVDLVGGLPMQHHAKWTARGFQYVTLASRDDLVAVSHPGLQEQGVAPLRDWARYVQNRLTEGPWDAQVYLVDLAAARAERIAQLRATIAQFGREAAEQMEQRVWAAYRLPDSFARGLPLPPAAAQHQPGRPTTRARTA